MDYYTISQVLVAVAIVFDLLSFQFKDRKHVVTCLSVAGCLISTHFYLLDAITAACIMGIATFRYMTSYFTTHSYVRNLFLCLNVVSLIATYQSFTSIISFIGSSLQTIGAFSRNDREMRLIMMVGTLVWLVHNVVVNSPMAIVMEIVFLVSNLAAYYRFYLKRRAC